MSITFTPVLKKKYSYHNYGTISIRITQNRISKYVPLGISLLERFWNKNGRNVESKLRVHRDFDVNERLGIINVIKSNIEELENSYKVKLDVSSTILNKNVSYLFHLKKHIELLEERKKIGTSKRYRTTLFHIEKYLKRENKSDLTFSELTSSFIESFETYLLGKNLIENTTKNYINCIKRLYTRLVKMGVYTTPLDPFVNFVNKRKPVEKEYLEKKHVDLVRQLTLSNDHPLYHTRNYFLFQIFSQGLRVSDLLTLKFSNIREGVIEFIQYKTKKSHIVYITDTVLFILKNYINDDKVEMVFQLKYKYSFNGTEYRETYEQVQDRYSGLTQLFVKTPLGKTEERKKMEKDVELFWKVLDKVRTNIFERLLIILHNYSKHHQDEFIFPILNPELFEGVNFNENTSLTKKQYNHLQSKTTLYNRSLKKLQNEITEQFEVVIDIPFTSHIPRHTYTNLMLQIGGDVYEISKSIGHMGIKTTDNYIRTIKQRIENKNKDLGKEFSYFMK